MISPPNVFENLLILHIVFILLIFSEQYNLRIGFSGHILLTR